MLTEVGFLTIMCLASAQDLPCERKYFSGGVQPRGAPFLADTRRVGICQRYRGNDYYYTLFDTRYRIAVYSAYVPAPVPKKGGRKGRRRTGRWYVEHSLAEASKGDQGMDQWPGSRGRVKRPLLDQLPYHQAVDDDYADSGFNRGHLNPHFIQDGTDARLSTFTLTNAVPQEPCFNQGAWKRSEELFDDVFVTFCHARNGTVHALTGAVPNYPAADGDLQKTRTISCGDNEDGCSLWRPKDGHDVYHRVNIPTRMWTASCCRYSAADGAHAVAYHHSGLNARDGKVVINVGGNELRHFEQQMRQWYYDEQGGYDVSLFGDDRCTTGENEAEVQIRETLIKEAEDDRSIEIGGNLRLIPERERSRLLSLQLTQELDPMLLHALGADRNVKELTLRIYGLLATGHYFVTCVDPLENYVHTHNPDETHQHALAAPYCTLSMSYEPGEAIPDLSQLQPPFPLPAHALDGLGGLTGGREGRSEGHDAVQGGVRSCGAVVQLMEMSGRVSSDQAVQPTEAGDTGGCQLHVSGDQLSFLSATIQASRLNPGEYIDVYDGLSWMFRINSTAPARFMTSKHQLMLHLSTPALTWHLDYLQHSGELTSGDAVVLIDQRTCAALSHPHRRRSWPHVRFLPTPSGAARHFILLDSATVGSRIVANQRVRLRASRTTDADYDILYSSYSANIYYDRFDDSSKQLWRVGGLPRHGGIITLANIRYSGYFLGLKDQQIDDGGVYKGRLCRNDDRWLVYKLPGVLGESVTGLAGFEQMVRTSCAPGQNRPVCLT